MVSSRPTHLVSFGRRRGRRLRANRSTLMETLLPQLQLQLPGSGVLPLPQPGRKLWFEIGFGGGEHLLEQAARYPEVDFIGCEPFINGMARLLAEIDKRELVNIRLYDGDARLVLERLPDHSIEKLFVLFPDPWPKARHHKRRIVSQKSLELFHQKLIPGGLLRLATDHEDYSVWMLEQLLAFRKFAWQAQTSRDWKEPPADWIRTRYQAKAEIEGRNAIFLNYLAK